MPDFKTIIIVGVGPVPVGNPDKIYAPGLRLFAFSRFIHTAGFRVVMGEASFGDNKIKDSSNELLEENWERRILPLDHIRAAEIISQWITELKPVALISTTDVMNLALALTGSDLPKWMDFFGHPMVERQEISYIHNCDDGLSGQWLTILPSLLTGDHFSTCSTSQKHALIGELGSVGRLNRHTSGIDMVSVIAPGSVFHEPEADGRPAFRGKTVSNEDFCLLWNGGFNTWVDEKTLFKGVSIAMEKSKRIHFILTGGAIRGHNEKTFSNFMEMVNSSSLSNRFHFFGWVPMNDLPNFYKESDAAVNIDRFTYEGILGTRNRIFSWMNFEIPVLTTPLSELTKMLVSKGLAKGFSINNPGELADSILDMDKDSLNNTGKYKDIAKKAKKFLEEEYTYEKLLEPLLKWIENPKISPDRKAKNLYRFEKFFIPDNSLSILHYEALKKSGKDKEQKEKIRLLESELDRIKGSRSWQIIERIKKILGR
jgi:glycosyltransferase involved in cell wall biosynthesis